MPNQLALSRTGWITDSTGKVIGMTVANTTGDYDVDDNPGGFGTPNLARNEIFIQVYASRYDSASNSLLPLVVADYDGLTDEEYTVYFDGDGIFVIHGFIPPVATPTGTIPVGTQWYDTADLAFRQTTFDDTTAGAEMILDLDTALEGLAIGDVEIHERSIAQANEIVDIKFTATDCGCQCDTTEFEDYLRLNAWLDAGVIRAFNIANFFGAARSLDAINAES